MLVHLAIADAYGMGFEFVPQEIIEKENNLSGFREHGYWHQLGAGQYTDDTQMSVAIAELLLENSRPTKLDFANKFVSVFKRDPRKGYAKGFQSVLESVKDGNELIERIDAFGKGTSNGSVMRAAILGRMVKDINDILYLTEIHSEITHTGTSIFAAQVIAVATRLLMEGCSPFKLTQEINSVMRTYVDWSWDGSRVQGKNDLGLNTARAALEAFISTGSYKDCLRKAVGYGGDTDSVASIACALVSVSKYHNKEIPESLINKFENKEFGLDFLIELDKKIEQATKAV